MIVFCQWSRPLTYYIHTDQTPIQFGRTELTLHRTQCQSLYTQCIKHCRWVKWRRWSWTEHKTASPCCRDTSCEQKKCGKCGNLKMRRSLFAYMVYSEWRNSTRNSWQAVHCSNTLSLQDGGGNIRRQNGVIVTQRIASSTHNEQVFRSVLSDQFQTHGD